MAATKTKTKVRVKTTPAKRVASNDPRQPGFSFINPCLSVKQPKREIEFLVRAFGFKKGETFSHEGNIVHADLKLGDNTIMLGLENPKLCKGALTLGGSPPSLYIYVKDVDATTKQAKSVGGKIVQEPADQFWGDRVAGIVDPEGYAWYVATHTGKFSNPDFGGCCGDK